jgi:hypothetical protein
MRGLKRGCLFVSMVFAILLRIAAAQVVTTTVQDTVYRADGTPAGGSVLVSWGAFTTAGGESISAGTTSVTLGAGGALSVALAPNAGATPMGSYYTAVFHLNDGTTSKEYWVVPVAVPGGGPAKLAAIENQVLPTSVAMQTVSKQYVDNAISQAIIGYPHDTSPYVMKTGDTMTGPLVLPADPVSSYQAADKNYVDENLAGISTGLGQKVSLFPAATQVVVQPSGTQLDVNLLNGEVYASQYQTGQGGNGIGNALASPDCATTCRLVADATYTGSDVVAGTGAAKNGFVFVDERGGAESHLMFNPLGASSPALTGELISQTETISVPQLNALEPGVLGLSSTVLSLNSEAAAGGSNLDPQGIETVPYAKSTYSVLSLNGNYNTQGQHIQSSNVVNCYSVGDCLAGGMFINSSGGYRDSSDEGTHPFDLEVSEDFQTYTSTCLSGCTTGSTTVTASGSSNLGDGRFLIDKNPAKVLNTGLLTGGARTIFGTASFSGTSFPVSVFLTTAQSATSQPANMAPGTVTLPIATTGVTAGFATNTAALPASSGVACVADPYSSFPYYEMANYSVVDGTHLQLTLNKPHSSGATIAVGGLCGYGIEQTVDSYGAIRQVFPVIGSMDGSDLYYADALTPVVGGGIAGFGTTSGYLNVSVPVASLVRSGNVVTATLAAGLGPDVNGLTLTVSGAADSSYNGSYVVSTTSNTSLTYANTGPDSTSTGGTVSIVTGGFALYPMAEVLSVFNPVTKAIDGTMSLAPNTVAWATGDAIEEPHYYQQQTFADTEVVTQYVPRPTQFVSAGKQYDGEVGPGVRGWQINNDVPSNNYLGAGGTHHVPDYAYVAAGAWLEDFDVDAGTEAVIHSHCNLMGCNRWDSAYDLFLLDSEAGSDSLNYSPQTSTVAWNMRGSGYSFSPDSFTASTINVGTLNATTITGGVNGGAITSGTISAARLPLFGPSGTTHAPGIVPDPGATAGSTRYLREDGTWDVPAGGGGGSPTGSAGGDLSGTYPNPTVTAIHATSGNANDVGLTATYITDAISSADFRSNWVPDVAATGAYLSDSVVGDSLYRNLNGRVLFGATTGHSAMQINADNSVGFYGNITAPAYIGPATAPAGSCATSGAWVFSQDGHATFCASGTWVTKI